MIIHSVESCSSFDPKQIAERLIVGFRNVFFEINENALSDIAIIHSENLLQLHFSDFGRNAVNTENMVDRAGKPGFEGNRVARGHQRGVLNTGNEDLRFRELFVRPIGAVVTENLLCARGIVFSDNAQAHGSGISGKKEILDDRVILASARHCGQLKADRHDRAYALVRFPLHLLPLERAKNINEIGEQMIPTVFATR